MNLITTQDALQAFCSQLATQNYITIDTEFLREKTFWPKLCLIQAASPDVEAMIDPLVESLDLQPFFELLGNEKLLKVMHGCRQDIEIFYNLTQEIPHPLFDTQIAAMVCGFGDAVGYETLVKATTGGKIDKTNRFTDWSHRPLSDAQLAYALADVTHLRGAYEFLANKLAENKRQEWVNEEMAILRDPAIYVQSPSDGWKRLKMHDRRPAVIGTLMEVTQWRDEQAQSRNLPRNWVLKDDALREIALQRPRDKTALARLRAVPRGFENSRHAQALLDAVQQGKKLTADNMPNLPEIVTNRRGIGPLVDLLRVLLKQRSEATDVAPKLIASIADLECIASQDKADIAAMQGWRYEIFGAYAEKLKNGRLALASQDDVVTLIEL
ncbi:MAG: ribonuclease D [Parvibaculales bacterium]